MNSRVRGFMHRMSGIAWLKKERDRGLYIRKMREKRRNYKATRFESEDAPFVSLIIIGEDQKDKLKTLMKSLHSCRCYKRYEIIFVDNASRDGSSDYMEQWKEKSDVAIIKNKVGVSFAAANNMGAKRAKGDYLVFLSCDTEVTDGWLDELLKAAVKKENMGAVGAGLVYPKVSRKEKNYDKIYKILHTGVGFREKIRNKQYFIQPYYMGDGCDVYGQECGVAERACVSAAAMLISAKVFMEIGGFDEKYMHCFEGEDLCLKLLNAGYHNYCCGDCLVYYHASDMTRTDDEKKIDGERRHDMQLYMGKWQTFLYERLLMDKIQNMRIYTEQKLLIGICYDKMQWENKDQRSAELTAFIKKCKQRGYKIKYLRPSEGESWYDINVRMDMIISATEEYDFSEVKCAKPDLIFIEFRSDAYHMLMAQGPSALERIAAGTWTEALNEKEIDICGAMPGGDSKKFWGDWHYALALKKEFEKRGYQANVRTRERWYARSSAKYVLVLRGLKPYYPPVYRAEERRFFMWNISHPDDVTIEEYNLFDYVYFASLRMKKQMGELLSTDSGVLLQCTDPETMNAEETSDKKYELLFVGNSRGIYRQILKDLLPTQHKLTVYGRQWDNFPVKAYVAAEYFANEKVGQAYHDAKILLNDHWEDMQRHGIISNRIFDALAAGAFVISDDMPELQDVLQGAVVTYKDPEDLQQKIDYYLQAEEERNEKIQLGMGLVREKHTFANRVETILKMIEENYG